MRLAAATTRTAPVRDPCAMDCVAVARVGRLGMSCWGGGGGGGSLFDAYHPVQSDVTRDHFDVLPSRSSKESKGWTGRCPDWHRYPLRCSRLRWPEPVPVHTHGDWGVGEESRIGAAARFAWAPLQRRPWFCPAICHVVAARDV